MIYLDNASTTQVDPAVVDAMLPYFTEAYGNPGTIYGLGRQAKDAVDLARERVADLIHAKPEQIIFTSGGSEANNLALFGAADFLIETGKVMIGTSRIEHQSILESCRELSKRSMSVQYLLPNSDGVVEVQEVKKFFENYRRYTGIFSLMKTNNETGAENYANEIAVLCKEHGVLFHTDCVQAITCQRIDVEEIGCTSLSISSHKIHGPKGVGALYLNAPKGVYKPMIYGGHTQEFGLRAGTENVPGIVGFGKACEILQKNLRETEIHVSLCKQKFFTALQKKLEEQEIGDILHVNGAPAIRRGKTLNIRFDGVDAQTLILMLDVRGVYVSGGSACTAAESKPSHVLKAMGLTDEQAHNSIRVSFSRMNTEEEAEKAGVICGECVGVLRRLSA